MFLILYTDPLLRIPLQIILSPSFSSSVQQTTLHMVCTLHAISKILDIYRQMQGIVGATLHVMCLCLNVCMIYILHI